MTHRGGLRGYDGDVAAKIRGRRWRLRCRRPLERARFESANEGRRRGQHATTHQSHGRGGVSSEGEARRERVKTRKNTHESAGALGWPLEGGGEVESSVGGGQVTTASGKSRAREGGSEGGPEKKGRSTTAQWPVWRASSGGPVAGGGQSKAPARRSRKNETTIGRRKQDRAARGGVVQRRAGGSLGPGSVARLVGVFRRSRACARSRSSRRSRSAAHGARKRAGEGGREPREGRTRRRARRRRRDSTTGLQPSLPDWGRRDRIETPWTRRVGAGSTTPFGRDQWRAPCI